jgi:hypothetical protein
MVTEQQFVRALGEAALALWSRMPHDYQQMLFERAVSARGEPMRQELATFLHDRHPRTADALVRARDVPEPDSLGG